MVSVSIVEAWNKLINELTEFYGYENEAIRRFKEFGLLLEQAAKQAKTLTELAEIHRNIQLVVADGKVNLKLLEKWVPFDVEVKQEKKEK